MNAAVLESHSGQRRECEHGEPVVQAWCKEDRARKGPVRVSLWSRQCLVKNSPFLNEWIHLKDPKPEFEFRFPKPAGTVNWMLCVKQKMGIDGEPGSIKAQGMQIVDVQTLDKKEQELLKKITMEKNNNNRKKEPTPVVRVKPKRRDP